MADVYRSHSHLNKASCLIAAMNNITDYDRRGFFRHHIYEIAPKAPLDGLTLSCSKLSFDDTPNPFLISLEEISGTADFSSSLGICWLTAAPVKEMRAGDLFYFAPGHDCWVMGVEPYISLHFLGASNYDKHE
jgi:hypothetical protein